MDEQLRWLTYYRNLADAAYRDGDMDQYKECNRKGDAIWDELKDLDYDDYREQKSNL